MVRERKIHRQQEILGWTAARHRRHAEGAIKEATKYGNDIAKEGARRRAPQVRPDAGHRAHTRGKARVDFFISTNRVC
jgi:hypothetical protein